MQRNFFHTILMQKYHVKFKITLKSIKCDTNYSNIDYIPQLLMPYSGSVYDEVLLERYEYFGKPQVWYIKIIQPCSEVQGEGIRRVQTNPPFKPGFNNSQLSRYVALILNLFKYNSFYVSNSVKNVQYADQMLMRIKCSVKLGTTKIFCINTCNVQPIIWQLFFRC